MEPTPGPTPTPIIVACAGDSITQGGHEEDLVDGTAGHSYPELLQDLLGPAYRVLNFGRSGTSVGPEKPWRTEGHFESMIDVKYDFAILTFGANDAKTDRCEACWGADWDSHADEWAKNYVDLISDLRDYNPTAKFFLGINTPYLGGSSKWGTEALTVVNDILPVSSAEVASVIGARGTVDFRSGFVLPDGTFDSTLYDDKIHPNNAGYAAMAAAAYTALLNPNMLDVPAPSRAPTYAPTYTPSPGPTASMVPTTSLFCANYKPSPAPSTLYVDGRAVRAARPSLSPSAAPSRRRRPRGPRRRRAHGATVSDTDDRSTDDVEAGVVICADGLVIYSTTDPLRDRGRRDHDTDGLWYCGRGRPSPPIGLRIHTGDDGWRRSGAGDGHHLRRYAPAPDGHADYPIRRRAYFSAAEALARDMAAPRRRTSTLL